MWGLEYALLFGVPNNKWEILEGRFRCACPFLDRELAEAHFATWTRTLCQWQDVSTVPSVRKKPREWQVEVNGFAMTLYRKPIDLRIPLDCKVFEAFYRSFWRRDLWPMQPPGRQTGWDNIHRHSEVQLNLWSLFDKVCEQYGGLHGGRVDLAMSDTVAVTPDLVYFQASPQDCMIEGEYFLGVPSLVIEVLSPATRAMDRGPRKDLYRRAGVRHSWLVDPEIESVEIHELAGTEYQLQANLRAGDEFRPALFPELTVAVDQLFETQWKRHSQRRSRQEPQPIPEWLVSRDERLGLQYLLLLGHPERRYEIWNNRAPCLLAFGSPEEARLRFGHFLEDICRWEIASSARPTAMAPETEMAEVGRFRLTRHGRHVSLDVAVDARKYRDMLQVWAQRQAWDWGEQ